MAYPKPKVLAQILASRKLFFCNKIKAKEAKEADVVPQTIKPKETKVTPHDIWRPPEHNEHNKCVIHGKSHIYNPAKPSSQHS